MDSKALTTSRRMKIFVLVVLYYVKPVPFALDLIQGLVVAFVDLDRSKGARHAAFFVCDSVGKESHELLRLVVLRLAILNWVAANYLRTFRH